MDYENLPEAGQSLGLDRQLQQGLTGITVLAFLSFLSSTTLFLYLGYKIIWHTYFSSPSITRSPSHDQDRPQQDQQQGNSFQRRVDFALGIDGIFSDDAASERDPKTFTSDRDSVCSRNAAANSASSALKAPKKNPPNQFLILIFNLLLADMHQGVAFFTNAEWLRYNEIRVGTPICFAQGLFVSLGDLASSCFITTIAVHTYLSIVRRYTIRHRTLYMILVAIWLFIYGISLIPVAATRNGADHGGFFVRAGAWCWMNNQYSILRFVTHYLYIFIAIATTTILYTLVFISIRRQSRTPPSSSQSAAAAIQELNLSHNPAFLIYPVIYVVCTLPLAIGRIATMAQTDVPLGYMCFAGAMIASNGFFDCLLFGTTRNVIVFASKTDIGRSNTGLDTFNFMQTPRTRRYGNMVWVQGGSGGRTAGSSNNNRYPRSEDAGPSSTITGGWWSWARIGGAADRARGVNKRAISDTRTVSEESLRGPEGAVIQMDTVTSVVVETDQYQMRDHHFSGPSASMTPSMTTTSSMDKVYPRHM